MVQSLKIKSVVQSFDKIRSWFNEEARLLQRLKTMGIFSQCLSAVEVTAS